MAENRQGLEQLCCYVARSALATGRLRIVDPDQLAFALKTLWSDGTTHLMLSPHELLEKLAALVPPPRLNLIRYHGVLAPIWSFLEGVGLPARPPPIASARPSSQSEFELRPEPSALLRPHRPPARKQLLYSQPKILFAHEGSHLSPSG